MIARYISPKQAARTLGVDRLTIYKMIKDGDLPAIRVHRATRIPRSAIDGLPSYQDAEGQRQ